jgi:hypothetical protein
MDSAEPIQLVWESPACGTAEGFRTQVLARTTRATFVERDPRRTFRVTIRVAPAKADKVVGKLVVTDGHGGTTERSLGAAPCDELVEALALVTAIAIDPAASTKPLAELGPAVLAYPADEPGPIVKLPWDPAPAAPRDAPPPPAARARWRAVALAHAGLVAGPLPSTAAHFGGGLGVVREAGLFSQELRATVAGTTTADATASGATAGFSSVRVDLSFSPLRPRWKLVTAAPLAAATLLLVSVTPSGVNDPQPTSRWVPLVALGARGGLEAGPLFAELELRLAIPLTRERYFVDPQLTLFQAAPLAFDGALVFGVRFP